MAYSAAISNKRIEGRNVIADLTVSLDGKAIEVQQLRGDDVSAETAAVRANLIIASHQKALAAIDALPEGEIDLTGSAYEVVAAPFFTAQDKLVSVQKATADGLLKGTELAAAEVAYKTAFIAVENAGFMEKALTDPRYKR